MPDETPPATYPDPLGPQHPCALCGAPTRYRSGTGHYFCAPCRTRAEDPVDAGWDRPDPDPLADLEVPEGLSIEDLPASGSLINWDNFWNQDRDEADWLIEPVVPRGRAIAIWAPAGEGKSELVLALAAGAASGAAILDRPAGKPLKVIYLDEEQTDEDVYDRLTELGYGPHSDLTNLFYYLLPDLPPLDTAEGGRQLRLLANHHDADLVVIDTTGRVLEGAENDADTIRAYHQHTGRLLKFDGRTVLRLDHAGKDLAKGQRGTSAKNDDVDLIWRVKRRDNGTRLEAMKRRQGWVPESVELARRTDPLQYNLAPGGWPAGTAEATALLERIGVPPEAGRRRARKFLADANEAMSNELLSAALKYRRQLIPDEFHKGTKVSADSPDTQNLPVSGHVSGHTPETRTTKPPDTSPDTSGHVVAGQEGTRGRLQTDTLPGPAKCSLCEHPIAGGHRYDCPSFDLPENIA